MASTNKTTHYDLSQFVGSDIPAWLVDYNGDMGKIDTGIAQAKTTADTAGQTADTAIANAQNAQETANTAVINAAAAQATATGADTKIGDLAELTTVDKTSVVGAVNEIKEDLTDVEGAINTLVVDSMAGEETDKAPSVLASSTYVKDQIDLIKPVILYENATGSNGNITLSQTVDNYDYIEIFFRQNQYIFNSVKVYAPNNKLVSLTVSAPNAGTNVHWLQMRVVKILNNTISTNTNMTGQTSLGTNAITSYSDNHIYITKVVGVKY